MRIPEHGDGESEDGPVDSSQAETADELLLSLSPYSSWREGKLGVDSGKTWTTSETAGLPKKNHSNIPSTVAYVNHRGNATLKSPEKKEVVAASKSERQAREDEPAVEPKCIVRSPRLTPQLIAAIRLIVPHLDLSPCEESRRVWEMDQNASCWAEYESLAPLLTRLQKPKSVLEIGPGLGRSIIFFTKMFGWDSSAFHAYEGNGDVAKYTLMGPRFKDSYCGNIPMLNEMLKHNGIHNVVVFDARRTALSELPGPYDLLFSFFGIGFHWALDHFWEDLLPLMDSSTVAVFTVPHHFRGFRYMNDVFHRVLPLRPVWPPGAEMGLLVVSFSPLPQGF
jgi:hypothetical protein